MLGRQTRLTRQFALPSLEAKITSFALVSNRQPATAVPPASWAHDVRNVLASVGIHLDALARLSGPHGARAANAGHALISKVSSDYRALQSQVRELQRLLGKKMLEAEILKEALEHATGSTKTAAAAAVGAEGRFAMKTVAEVIGVSRSNLIERMQERDLFSGVIAAHA